MVRRTTLSQHVLQFARFLRQKNFNLGPDEVADALLGLEAIDWSSPDEFKLVLQGCFCKNFNQYLAFEKLYSAYWWELSKAVDAKTKDVAEEKQRPTAPAPPSLEVIKNWLHGNRVQEDELDLRQASADQVLSSADLSMLATDHQQGWAEVIRLMRRHVARKKARRMIKSRKVAQVDFRKVLKRSMQRGGEIHQFEFKKRKETKTHIVLICDVSKSMEMYSRFVIQMMYALQNSALKIHCFVFSTSLHSVTRSLKRQRLAEALDSLSQQVNEWSGGTQIGASIQQYIEEFGRKTLNKSSFTMIVSDGWDGGDIALLDTSLAKLKKRSQQLIWINPLANSESYNPQVLGMKTAMPYIDHLVPALDPQSLHRYLRPIL